MAFESRRSSLGLCNTTLFRPPYHAPVEIIELERQRDRCKHSRQYKKAQQLEDRLHDLKKGNEAAVLKDLQRHQAEELAASDASFQHASKQTLQEWDVCICGLHGQLQQAEQQMLTRQNEEEACLLAIQATVQPRPKFSPALLNMRHIERTLASQKEFNKADKVKQQADQQELLELSQMGAERASKHEADRAHLATRHMKEREAAAKKAMSALLAAQQRQNYELEQLTRRNQAIQLSLSRTHAAQRLSLQQSLRGTLGLAKPSKLLGLPSFNSSLAETRGLLPQSPAVTTGFNSPLPQQPCSAVRCRSPSAASGLYHASVDTATASIGATADGQERLSSPQCCYSPETCADYGDARRSHCAARTDAAAAAAGYGLSMPPLTAARGSRLAACSRNSGRACMRARNMQNSSSSDAATNAVRPPKRAPAGISSDAPMRPFTRAGGSRSVGIPGTRGCRNSLSSIEGHFGKDISTTGSNSNSNMSGRLSTAFGAIPSPGSSATPMPKPIPGGLQCSSGVGLCDSSMCSTGGSSNCSKPSITNAAGKSVIASAELLSLADGAASASSSRCPRPWGAGPVDHAATAVPRIRLSSSPTASQGANLDSAVKLDCQPDRAASPVGLRLVVSVDEGSVEQHVSGLHKAAAAATENSVPTAGAAADVVLPERQEEHQEQQKQGQKQHVEVEPESQPGKQRLAAAALGKLLAAAQDHANDEFTEEVAAGGVQAVTETLIELAKHPSGAVLHSQSRGANQSSSSVDVKPAAEPSYSASKFEDMDAVVSAGDAAAESCGQMQADADELGGSGRLFGVPGSSLLQDESEDD